MRILAMVLSVALAACGAPEWVAGDAGVSSPPDSGRVDSGALDASRLDAGAVEDAGPAPALDVTAEMEAIRLDAGLVAIAALQWRDGGVVLEGAAGLRKLGTDAGVGLEDRWHLASCGKAMTATVAAISVERGELAWSTTLRDVFGDAGVSDGLAAVTLEQLLRHRSGLQRDFDGRVRATFGVDRPAHQQRAEAMGSVLLEPPTSPVGAYAYSNVGYVVAGTMLERVTGVPFERLRDDRLFAPLGMTGCGDGLPHDGLHVDQPWGHRATGGAMPVVGRQLDFVAETPAGSTHCRLRDWAAFVAMHVRGEREATLVSTSTMQRLHAPSTGGTYAMGWFAVPRAWAKGMALTHSGSLGIYASLVWAGPNTGEFTLAASNQDDDLDRTQKALDRAVTHLSTR